MSSIAPSHPEIKHYWRDLRETLKARFIKPWGHPTFVMYFVIIIVVIGSFGIIEPVLLHYAFKSMNGGDAARMLISASYTYFVAIAATAAVGSVLSLRHQKSLLMFFICSSFAVVALAFWAACARDKTLWALLPSAAGYLLALFLWWVGNADNVDLLDDPIKPTSPTGGDVQVPVAGNLAGFQS